MLVEPLGEVCETLAKIIFIWQCCRVNEMGSLLTVEKTVWGGLTILFVRFFLIYLF